MPHNSRQSGRSKYEQRGNDKYPKKEGAGKDLGEYIDFEEIKD